MQMSTFPIIIKAMETLGYVSYVEAKVMNIYAKFQLHPPYGFSEEDFLIFFFKN